MLEQLIPLPLAHRMGRILPLATAVFTGLSGTWQNHPGKEASLGALIFFVV